MGDVKKETLSGAKWQLLQKCTMQPVQFVFSMILARLITPEEFGILGLTAVFFAVAMQLQDCGFGSALIRNIHRTEEDINTVFWTNVGLSFLLASILFASAPLFVWFFHQPALLWLTRVMALLMFVQSTGSVHWTLYSCRRDFKTPAMINMASAMVAMPACILAAYAGWSYWAVVTQSIVSAAISLCWVWLVSPWRPSLMWSRKSFRASFSYGSKLMMKGMLSALIGNMRSLLVGKFFSPAALGLYTRGWHVAELPITTFTSVLGPVTFPILATLQENQDRLLEVYSKYIRITSLAIFFGCALLIALAEPFINVCFGPSWSECAVYAQILTWAAMSYHIGLVNENLLLVKGRSDIALRIFVFKSVLHYAALIPAMFLGMKAVCLAAVVVVPPGLLINTYYTGKLCGLPLSRQVKDFLPYLVKAVLCCAPAYALTFVPMHPILQLLCGGSSAVLLYVAWLHAEKDVAYCMLLDVAAKSPVVVLFRSRFFSAS